MSPKNGKTYLGQPKWHSRFEIFSNYFSGFIIAWATWKYIVDPLIQHGYLTNADAFYITSIFTVASILRSYFWRRLFNWIHVKGYF